MNPFNVEQDLTNCTGISRTLLVLFIDRNHHIKPDFELIISSFGGFLAVFASPELILQRRFLLLPNILHFSQSTTNLKLRHYH